MAIKKKGMGAAAALTFCALVGSSQAAVMTISTATPGWEVSEDGTTWFAPVVTATYLPGGFAVPALWSSLTIGAGELRFFRFSFDLPGTATAATLFTAQDDDIRFRINGGVVFEEFDFFAGGSPALDVTAALTPGTNSFLVDLLNTQCCGAGMGMHLDITFTPNQAPVPATLPLLLLGLGAAGWQKGRSRKT